MKSPLLGLSLTVLALVSSCRSVQFYERQLLANPTMMIERSLAETHFRQKVFYSQEGSAGGIGVTAGGGCGCY